MKPALMKPALVKPALVKPALTARTPISTSFAYQLYFRSGVPGHRKKD
jgi:hypothetical protein